MFWQCGKTSSRGRQAFTKQTYLRSQFADGHGKIGEFVPRVHAASRRKISLQAAKNSGQNRRPIIRQHRQHTRLDTTMLRRETQINVGRSSMSLSSEAIVAITAVSSALIGTLPGIVAAWIAHRSEERRHFREIAVNAAIKSWERRFDLMKEQGGAVTPLEHFTIHAVQMFKLAFDDDLSEGLLRTRLQEIKKKMDILAEHMETFHKKAADSRRDRA
jgi:hypothetical protein